MKKSIMRLLFWLTWPAVWVYTPFRKCARILVVKDDSFLLVKPFFSGGKWQLPGGGIKRGEKPNDTASRELQEEVGIFGIEPELIVPLKMYKEHGLFVKYELFYAKVNTTVVTEKNYEIEQVSWVKLSEYTRYGPSVQEAVRAIVTPDLIQ